MNLDTPEDITPGLYKKLPFVIDNYFTDDGHKAIQDKSTLAEMIGRYGPKDGWEWALDALLEEEDDNLKQFSLQSLEYSARNDIELVMPYIERYISGDDELMQSVAAKLISRIVSSENINYILMKLEEWNLSGDNDFIKLIKKYTERNQLRKEDFTQTKVYKDFVKNLNLFIESN